MIAREPGGAGWFQWRTLAENALALYGAQAAAYVLPLVTVPYLARVLGPGSWGRVAMAQALAAYVALVVEYGFHLSGTREVARARGYRDRLSRLLVEVLSARGFLALSLLPVVVILAQFVPQLSDEPQLVWAAYGAGVSQGLTATWFWQGLERMHLVGALELVGRAAATVGVFALVRGQDDAAFVLWLQAAGGLLAAVVGYGLAVARFAPLRTPRWRDVTGGLRLGWSMFAFRSAVSLYTAGNTFILGLFVPASQVGYYAGAERITRTLQGLLGPISQTLYPRVSHLIHQSQREAAHLVLSAMRLVLAGSLVIYAVTLAGAPTWVNLFLGREFMPAISVLRVLAAVVPLVALSHVLGIQWMLPRGLDRDFNRIIASAGALNVVLAVALAPRYGPLGMAAAVVTSEVFVAAAMYVYLRLGHLDPRSALSRHGVPS